MLRLLPALLLLGCVSTRGPHPSDTEFKEEDKSWKQIFIQEMEIAVENKDNEAYYFFLQEIVKEEYKEKYGKELPANPDIKIIK
jgi:hypothetical protein